MNYYRHIEGELVVTLKRRGHLSQRRNLKWTAYESKPNADRMDKWEYSLVNFQDLDPRGSTDYVGSRERQDPGYVLGKYIGSLDGLEVLASKNMKGKWMIKPRSLEERLALYKTKQDAKVQAQLAAKSSQRKQAISAEQSALAFLELAKINAAMRTKAEVQKQTPQAAVRSPQRTASSKSVMSMSAKKGPRTSITSINTTDTSTTRSNGAVRGGGTRHRLSRAFFGGDKTST